MKKLIIALAMLIGISYGQARIGFREMEIRKEFNQVWWSSSWGEESNRKFIHASFGDYVVYHFFDHNGVCDVSIIQPLSSAELQKRIDYYSITCIEIVRGKEWVHNGVRMELEYSPDMDAYVFFCTRF